MKKYLFLLLACFLACATLNSCSSNDEALDQPIVDPNGGGNGGNGGNDDPGDEIVATCSAEVTSLQPGNVSVKLTTENLKSYAYLMYTKEEMPDTAPDMQVVNATGMKGELKDGENVIRLGSAIQPATDYTVYFALTTTKDTFYKELVTVPFTTAEVNETVTLLQQKPDGIVVNINIPQSVTDAGNVLKWSITNWYTFVTRIAPDVNNLIFNGQKYINKSQALDICNANAYHETEVDEEGDPFQFYDIMAPGEPLVFLLGEFQWVEDFAGWGPGYHTPLFDMEKFIADYPADMGLTAPLGKVDLSNYTKEDPYWTGYHSRHLFYTAKPEPMDKKVKWESYDPKPNHYTIRFTPDEGIASFCYFILSDEEYRAFTQGIGGEENWQWFVTSTAGMWEGAHAAVPQAGQDYLKGIYEITSEEILVSGVEPTPGETYHVILTAMGDKGGTTQSHVNATFTLPDYTLPVPEVTVTALDDKTTDTEAYFLVKNTKPEVPIAWAGYICGYQSDFGNNRDYASLITGPNGAQFSSEDIAKINSEEGLEVRFPGTRPNSVTRFAVMVKNEEGRRSDVNAKGSPAVAEVRTKRPADAPRVESELFTKLTGDWTATASVSVFNSNTKTFEPVAEPRQVKVTVQGGIEYTDKAPQVIYDNNPLWAPAQIEKEWENFKAEADIFNATVRGQNRLLCLGFGFEQTKPFGDRLLLQTPLDLFARPDYNTPSCANLFTEFGPKWYFQIAEGDKVTVPVNINTIGSLTSWADGTDYYMMGWSFANGESYCTYYNPGAAAGEDDTLYFPVTVSDDGNTITIHPFEYEGRKYYPSTTYFSKTTAGSPETTKTILTSPIVMTRGWNGKSASTTQYPPIRSTRAKTSSGPVRLERTPIEEPQPIQRLEVLSPKETVRQYVEYRKSR